MIQPQPQTQQPRKKKKMWVRILIFVLVIYPLALLIGTYLFENKMVFYPAKYPEGSGFSGEVWYFELAHRTAG